MENNEDIMALHRRGMIEVEPGRWMSKEKAREEEGQDRSIQYFLYQIINRLDHISETLDNLYRPHSANG